MNYTDPWWRLNHSLPISELWSSLHQCRFLDCHPPPTLWWAIPDETSLVNSRWHLISGWWEGWQFTLRNESDIESIGVKYWSTWKVHLITMLFPCPPCNPFLCTFSFHISQIFMIICFDHCSILSLGMKGFQMLGLRRLFRWKCAKASHPGHFGTYLMLAPYPFEHAVSRVKFF